MDSNKNLILTVKCNKSDGLWDIPPTPPSQPSQAANSIVHMNKTEKELYQFLHTACFIPAPSAFIQAIKVSTLPPEQGWQSNSSPITYDFIQHPQRATKNNNFKIFAPPQRLKLKHHPQIPIQNLNNSWGPPMIASWKWPQNNKAWPNQIFQVANQSIQNVEINISLSLMIMTATPFWQKPSHLDQAHASTKGSKKSLTHSQLLDTCPSSI